MNNKTFKAQITVMAALSMTIIFSLICTCVRSALDCFYNTQIKEACMLSVEGAFSAYHNDMLSEYDILLLQYSDNIKARIEQYAEENIYSCGKNVSLMGVDVDNVEYITDQGGIYLRKEIASYMQYGLFSEMADVMRQSEKELQKVEKIKEITSDIQDCEKDLWEVDLKILQLIKYVEGIETTDTGIVIRSGEPVSSGGYFAKSAVNGIVSRDSVYVDEKKVYMSIDNSEPGYTDVSALLDDMYEDASGVAASEENQKEEDYINSYSDVYRRNYIKLKAVLGGTKEQTEKALEVLGEYDDAKSGAENKLGGCMEKVSAEIKTLGEELCNELIEDLKSMKEDNASDKKTMCDMQQLRQALSRNLIVLNGVCSQIEKLEENLNYDNSRDVMSSVVRCRQLLYGLSAKGMKFDYSGVDFSIESSGLSAVKKVRQLITDGILALVMDTDNISEKSVNYAGLATDMSGKIESMESKAEEIKEQFLMNEYLMMKFNCFTDYLDMDIDESAGIDYTLEYILCGKSGDKENLEQTMLELSGIRTGMNLAYLITGKSKKMQAYSFAAGALGFTGNMALIKAGQYLIMSVWAYGEAIMDMRDLYAGNKVALVKNEKNWKLSLENLLGMKFDSDKDTDDDDLEYRDYIRMLLMLERSEHKNYRTMGAMEIKMISMGHDDFRMRNYIVSMAGTAVFSVIRRGQPYVQIISCSYI